MSRVNIPKLLTSGPATKINRFGAGSKIKFPDLQKSVIEFVDKKKSLAPIVPIQSGSLFRRFIPTPYMVDGSRTNVIFSEPGGDKNRCDGITVNGPTTPVIYLAKDTEAAKAEAIHYSDRARFAKPFLSFEELKNKGFLYLPLKSIVTYKMTQPVTLADFRMDSKEGMDFLKLLNKDDGVQKELAKTPFAHILQAIQALDDYSASRGLSFAADQILNTNGVTWNTARISRNADRFADNLTLKGEYQQPVEGLHPLFVQEYFIIDGKPYFIVKKLDKSINPEDYAHFPEGDRVEVQVPGIEDEYLKKR